MDLWKYFNGNTKVDIRKKNWERYDEAQNIVYKIQTLGAIFLLEVSYNLAINFLAAKV